MCSYDERCGHGIVRFAHGLDQGLAIGLCGSKIDEHHLIFVVVDDVGQCGHQVDAFTFGQLANEYAELDVVAIVVECFEDVVSAFIVADIIGHDVVSSVGGGVVIHRVTISGRLGMSFLSQRENSRAWSLIIDRQEQR